MAEIVARLVGPALELGKCIAVPIRRQFRYLCCFNSHIKSLQDEAKKLEKARDELQKRVDEAEGNGEEIVPEVENWLTSANIEIEASNKIPKVQSGCSTIISRYSLSKKAEKTTEAMKKHLDDYNKLRDDYNKFNDISLPAPSAATAPIPLGETCEFESRKKIEEDIMEALGSKEVSVIGIWGMGGVGKTTMAKRIMNRVLEEKIFDEAVITVVGQQEDKDQQVAMLKIQTEISESLKLELGVTTLVPRANDLRRRLKGRKRSLIVVDDIWQPFKLEDIGIPCESGDERHCTVLLTSRDRKVLTGMKAQKVYTIPALSETEALSLFTEKSGISPNDSNLLPLAKDIAEECGGLPLALVTVGSALKDEKRKPSWEDALQQLKDAKPIDMPSVLEKVYKPLRLSYDLLGSENAKSLFLLCCLFLEDSDIRLEYLTLFCMGLHIFEGPRNLKEVRNKVIKIVEMLKSRFLLLDGSFGGAVRMHDVVRDIAIFIASGKGLVDGNLGHNSYSECKWISFFPQEEDELPKTLWRNFPNLLILMMHSRKFGMIRSKEQIKIEDFQIKIEDFQIKIEDFSFLQGLNELSVLSFEHFAMKSMLITMPSLKNLRALHLVGCTLEDISVVGKLLTLEILSCCHCSDIKELPIEIGRLNRLKLLEFRFCGYLTKVPPGVLSNLFELEEFTMVWSFRGWESAKAKEKGSGNVNVSLCELQSLRKLMCLNIEIADYTLAAEDIPNFPKIVKYDIKLGDLDYSNFELVCSSDEECFEENEECFEKKMYINLPSPITVGNWIRKLASSSDKLQLAGYGWDILQAPNVKSLDFQNFLTVKDSFQIFHEVKHLVLFNPPKFKEMCNASIPQGFNFFKNLRRITIESLPVLKHAWGNSNQVVSLSNLRTVNIYNCGSLLNLFSPLEMTMAQDGFLQLEELTITDCGMLDEVFLIKKTEKHEEITSHLTCPQLKILELEYLNKLTIFSRGIESIEFPALTDMKIVHCPMLISLVSSSMGSHQNSASGQDDDSIHWFCEVKFGSLETLKIEGYNNFSNIWCHQIPDSFFTGLRKLEIVECDSIRSLFSCSIARNLVNLNHLDIRQCKEMVKVIEDEDEIIRETNCPLLLFPSLRYLRMKFLPKLGSFCLWKCNIELPRLECLIIEKCPMMKVFTMGSSISAPKLECLRYLMLTGTISPIRPDGHDDDTFHLFCNQEVTFGISVYLDISWCSDISSIWCHQISDSFFKGLNQIHIFGCDSIGSLFSHAIVRNLVNLKELKIGGCKEMVKVIEDDEEITRDTNCPLLFPNLQDLELDWLPKLGSFYEWRCDIEFPMLNHLSIDECPMMKVFTMRSSIRTPKLVSIKMDRRWTNVGELNEVLKLHHHSEGGEIVEVETV